MNNLGQTGVDFKFCSFSRKNMQCLLKIVKCKTGFILKIDTVGRPSNKQ